MKIKNQIFFLLMFLVKSPYAGWLCHKASSMREGRLLTTCGIGFGKREPEARRKALENAYQELDAICDRSIDCKEQELFIEPLRNECLLDGKEYKCYRGISATITKKKREKSQKAINHRKKERIEIIINNEIKEREKVSPYSCDYDYTKVTNLLKDNQIHNAANLMKSIPFKLKCNDYHFRFMRTLLKLKKFPSSYVNFLYSLVGTFEGEWKDPRPIAILDYLYKKGEWDKRGWKRIYLSIKSTNPNQFYRYSKLLFHLETSQREVQKTRIEGFLQDVKNHRIGFPNKLSYQKAFSNLICRVPKEAGHYWFLNSLFENFKNQKLTLDKNKDILNCLKKTEKWSLDEKERRKITSWISLIIKNSTNHSDSRDFLISYISDLDKKIKKLDDTISEEEEEINHLKERRREIISISRSFSNILFKKVEKKHRRKGIIEFCLKEGLTCGVVPSFNSIQKRLNSKKFKTVEETTYYLTLMPKESFRLKKELLSLLEIHGNYKVRSNCIEALINTSISKKDDLDILLKHSWNRAYSYEDLAKKLGKRLLVSLVPIVKDPLNKKRDLAIEMLGIIGSEARDAVPTLKQVLKEKLHYSTKNRIEKSLQKINGR